MKHIMEAQEEEVMRLRAQNKVIPDMVTHRDELALRVARLQNQLESYTYTHVMPSMERKKQL